MNYKNLKPLKAIKPTAYCNLTTTAVKVVEAFLRVYETKYFIYTKNVCRIRSYH